MYELKVNGKTISQEDFNNFEVKSLADNNLIRMFAVKSRFTKQLWMKRCVKFRRKNSKFQGFTHTNWDKIETAKRR